MQLTNDSKAVLYKLYKEYSDRRKHGFPQMQSKSFGSAKSIQEKYFPDEYLEDVEDSLRELDCNGFIDVLYGDNTICECFLSDLGIATLEQLPWDAISNLFEFIQKLIL